ncbi:MAG: transcription antitermination factor NusB [Actinomycetota bacterium]|nr:transcription antitermination factor NusB [Actinomycetota bacterium]
MGRRRGARKLALDILYQSDLSHAPVEEVLQRYEGNPGFEFAEKLVRGVDDHREELDRLIAKHAQEWSIDRMPILDRNLLRIAIFEMLNVDDVPNAVAINEAVELARIYSTEDSSRFINGILGAVASST